MKNSEISVFIIIFLINIIIRILNNLSLMINPMSISPEKEIANGLNIMTKRTLENRYLAENVVYTESLESYKKYGT